MDKITPMGNCRDNWIWYFIYRIAKIDEVVIAQGDLQSSGAERPIKAPISGIVSSIPVKEGELVDSGQIILEFNTELSQEKPKITIKTNRN